MPFSHCFRLPDLLVRDNPDSKIQRLQLRQCPCILRAQRDKMCTPPFCTGCNNGEFLRPDKNSKARAKKRFNKIGDNDRITYVVVCVRNTKMSFHYFGIHHGVFFHWDGGGGWCGEGRFHVFCLQGVAAMSTTSRASCSGRRHHCETLRPLLGGLRPKNFLYGALRLGHFVSSRWMDGAA